MTAARFERLLAVQDHDTAADRLRHRRETLPERADLAALTERAGDLRTRITDAEARLASATGTQTHLEDELAHTETRIAEINKRMYGGEVSASRDLQAMAAEVESLEHRKAQLEERVLEAMEAREPIDAEVAGLRGEAGTMAAEARRLQQAIADAEAEIDAELGEEEAKRSAEAVGVPGDLIKTYEQIRTKLGGIGAARLEHGSCTGCHLTLSAMELEHLRHEAEDTVIHCEQCGRILVR